MRKIALLVLMAFILGVIVGCSPIWDSNLIELDKTQEDANSIVEGEDATDQTVDREGLLQVILMAEDWNGGLEKLNYYVEWFGWAGGVDKVELRNVAVDSVAFCDRFIAEYQTAEFKTELVTARAEFINLTNEVKASLGELITCIDEEDMPGTYYKRETFIEPLGRAQELQTYYTDYLTERVHLLPELDFSDLGYEFYWRIQRAEGTVWIRNYASRLKEEGKPPFSLEKLKGHAQEAVIALEELHNEYRFLNIKPDQGKYEHMYRIPSGTVGGYGNFKNLYEYILWCSAAHLSCYRFLIKAIEENDTKEVESCLFSGIIRIDGDIRSTLNPLAGPRP